MTLAHEIGHAFGMKDIYRIFDGEDDMVLRGIARYGWNVQDWNGGCSGHGRAGARYYEDATTQESLVMRMLMDGYKVDSANGVDITYGAVHGLDDAGNGEMRETGFFDNVYHVDNPTN